VGNVAVGATPPASARGLTFEIQKSATLLQDRSHPRSYRLNSRRHELLVRGDAEILGKFMKDSVVRGCLLQFLYERRSEGSIPFGHAEQAGPAASRYKSAVTGCVPWRSFSEYRLIDWVPLEDQSGMGLLSGFAKINDFGVKVLEAGVVAPPIRISIDERRRTTVPREQQAPIAPSTRQQTGDYEGPGGK